MGEHTPGPWDVFETDDFQMVFAQDDLSGINEDLGMWPEHIADDVRGEANAHLIAAAPDLLAALEAVEWVGHTGSGGQRCPWCKGTYPNHKPDCQRQAAIVKARGTDAS